MSQDLFQWLPVFNFRSVVAKRLYSHRIDNITAVGLPSELLCFRCLRIFDAGRVQFLLSAAHAFVREDCYSTGPLQEPLPRTT